MIENMIACVPIVDGVVVDAIRTPMIASSRRVVKRVTA
jgi:hypothetical protein